jgi:hypothetical protein
MPTTTSLSLAACGNTSAHGLADILSDTLRVQGSAAGTVGGRRLTVQWTRPAPTALVHLRYCALGGGSRGRTESVQEARLESGAVCVMRSALLPHTRLLLPETDEHCERHAEPLVESGCSALTFAGNLPSPKKVKGAVLSQSD